MKEKCLSLTHEQKAQICALPRKLTADDGRVFHIVEWRPALVFNKVPSVSIETMISLPDSK
jgi:hypothetical protein